MSKQHTGSNGVEHPIDIPLSDYEMSFGNADELSFEDLDVEAPAWQSEKK